MPVTLPLRITSLAVSALCFSCSPANVEESPSENPDVDEDLNQDPAAEEPLATAAGGGAQSEVEPNPATGGLGGAGSDVGSGAESGAEDTVTHPLFGAGSYSSVAPTDPCIAAQRWEESTNLDLTKGALILHEGVVYEVTGIGKSESTWADEWTAPPCTRTDGHCEDLAYQAVANCD